MGIGLQRNILQLCSLLMAMDDPGGHLAQCFVAADGANAAAVFDEQLGTADGRDGSFVERIQQAGAMESR